MKLSFWKKGKAPSKGQSPARGPSMATGYLYGPKAAVTQPHYEIAPLTDSCAIRVVERNNLLYPVWDGFGEALKRFIFGLEATTDPLDEEVLRDFPYKIRDQGDSIYTWMWLIPWPFWVDAKPSCWHPFFRLPPVTGGSRNVKTTDKDGSVHESTESVTVKGKLMLNVLHRGHVNVPALGVETAEEMVDYAHGFRSRGELSALAEVSINRAIHAEEMAAVEASRQSLDRYRQHFVAESQKGQSMPQMIQEQLAKLKRKGEREDDKDA